MGEQNRNFIMDYVTENKGKIDSDFINDYFGTGATIEVFIYRELNKKIYIKLYEEQYDKLYSELSERFQGLSKEELDKKIEKEMAEKVAEIETGVEIEIKKILGEETYDRINKVLDIYNNGIEGQDVSNCDFTSLEQKQFEMLRFDENTKFSDKTVAKFHPTEILKRSNTQIKNKTDSGEMLHVAIIDEPIVSSEDNKNLEVINHVDEGMPIIDDYHGRSAYSIFSSINPNCVVHFYGTSSMDVEKNMEYRASAIQNIINYNNTCTDDSEKIKLISCSHTLSDKEKELIMNNGINVISATNIHKGEFFEYFRFEGEDVKPTLSDVERTMLSERYSDEVVKPIAEKYMGIWDLYMKKAIFVNVNLAIDQPSMDGQESIKRHECDISVSWGVPVIAAYYAMALRKNPNMSYEEFYKICEKSIDAETRILDENLFMENIQAIEQEKTSENKSGKRKLREDYSEAVESSADLSYRLNPVNETTRLANDYIGRANEDRIGEEI